MRYDAKLADGLKHNYGASGWCTEVMKDFGTGRKVEPGKTCDDMGADTRRVGFVMGRRAGDSGLPHERGHLRTLGRRVEREIMPLSWTPSLPTFPYGSGEVSPAASAE